MTLPPQIVSCRHFWPGLPHCVGKADVRASLRVKGRVSPGRGLRPLSSRAICFDQAQRIILT
jgi:hypothetical protein